MSEEETKVEGEEVTPETTEEKTDGAEMPAEGSEENAA